MGNHGSHASSGVGLERAPRIPGKEIDSDSSHAQVDTGIATQTFNVGRGLQDLALNPEPTVLRKVSELGPVADRILEVKVGCLEP